MYKYLSIAIVAALIVATTFGTLYFRVREEMKREKENAIALILDKDKQVLLLSKYEMKLLIANDSIDRLLKENKINKNRITELSKVSVSYVDRILTIPKDSFIFLDTYRLVKYSNYCDGYNRIENILIGDSLINNLDIKDTIFDITYLSYKGWKMLPRIFKKKHEEKVFLNRNPKIKYTIERSSIRR